LPFGWRPAPLQAREKNGMGMTWHGDGKFWQSKPDYSGLLLSALAVGGARRIATGKELTRLDDTIEIPLLQEGRWVMYDYNDTWPAGVNKIGDLIVS
jgi:hypothetical protein